MPIPKLHKDIREIAKLAEEAGWRVIYRNGGHLKWVSPTGQFFFSSSTPSDNYAIAQIKRDLRRCGLIVDEKIRSKKPTAAQE